MAYDFGPHAKVDAAGFYPGNAYVHWIGADAYNLPGAPFRTQAELLDPALAFAVAHKKAVLVGETASLSARRRRRHGSRRTAPGRPRTRR